MNPRQEFSKVRLTLDNVIVPNERLRNTPSSKDGCPHDLEVDLRIVSCEYIQTAGILLRLPQVAMATAQVLFQRFFYSKSFIKYNMMHVAMACIFLAAKIEENCRRVRDIANVFHHMKQKRMGRPVVPMEYMGEEYFKLKATIILHERFLLKELGFCVHVKHPHKLIIAYLQILSLEQNTQLAQKSWNFMNDSLRTNVFVRFPPETIACACIFMSARQLRIGLPQEPPWWTPFDVCFEDIEAISLEVLALYRRPRVFLLDLEKKLNVFKEEFSKKQIKVKEINLKKPRSSSAGRSSDKPVTISLSLADERKSGGSKSSPNAACPIQSKLQPSPLLQSISTSPRNANHCSPPDPVTNGNKTKASPRASKHSLPPSPSSPGHLPAQKKRKLSSSPNLKSPALSGKSKVISPIRVAPCGGDSDAESSPPKENGIPVQYRRDYSKHNNRSSRAHRHGHQHHHSTTHRESRHHHHKGKEGRSSSRHSHQSKGHRTEHLERHR